MKKPKISSNYLHQVWVIVWKEDESLFDDIMYRTKDEAVLALDRNVINLANLVVIKKTQLAFY